MFVRSAKKLIAACAVGLILFVIPAIAAQSAEEAMTDLRIAELRLERAKAETKMTEGELNKAKRKVERFRELYAKGLIARCELESAEVAFRLAEAQHQAAQEVEAATREMVQRAKECLEKTVEVEKQQRELDLKVARISRSYGRGTWTTNDFAVLMREFKSRFKRDLPISAYGQTPTHDRLGLNHRGRIDVALHPNSEEGRWLIQYLNERGIPYTAFTGDMSHLATGPHIHIGPPSARQ